jgi:hypothetical protein
VAISVDRGALVLGLDLARHIAWGPYAGRIWATQALVARTHGDTAAELAALEAASEQFPWDPSLDELRSEAQIVQTDSNEAAEIWGSRKVVDVLVRRAGSAPTPIALELLTRAQSVAPSDARGYLAASDVLERSGRTREAATMLATAIRLQKSGPWGDALADRLLNRSTSLPSLDPIAVGYARDNAVLFTRAAHILDNLADVSGAQYARELARRNSGPA